MGGLVQGLGVVELVPTVDEKFLYIVLLVVVQDLGHESKELVTVLLVEYLKELVTVQPVLLVVLEEPMTVYLKVPVTVLQLVEYLKELVTVQPVLLVVLKEPMYLNVPVTVLATV